MPRVLPNMDTAIATSQADKKAAFTPKLGKVKPIDVISLERRETNEDTVADLVEDLARDGRFLHPIAVRDEGGTGYRLISGHQRLEAWKRHFGERQAIQAVIFPSHMPDARITLLDAGEDLHRKDLTPAERQAGLLRYAAASREELDGEKLATELPVWGSDAKSASRGGRGKKAATAKLAGKLGLSKAAVQKQIKAASEAIDEPIDLDHDTPEELERKADKRQRAEANIVCLKRRKPAPSVEDATPPAEPHAEEINSQVEVLWKAFDAIGRKHQLRFIHDACLRLRLDPLKMAPPATFGLADEAPELVSDSPAEAAPATDDAPVAQAEPGDDGTDLGAENLQVADDDGSEDTADGVSEAADQENLGAEDLEDAGDAVPEAADQEAAGATKCAYCNIPFESGDQLEEFSGKLYHGFCVEDGKRLAKAKQGKQVAMAA